MFDDSASINGVLSNCGWVKDLLKVAPSTETVWGEDLIHTPCATG